MRERERVCVCLCVCVRECVYAYVCVFVWESELARIHAIATAAATTKQQQLTEEEEKKKDRQYNNYIYQSRGHSLYIMVVFMTLVLAFCWSYSHLVQTTNEQTYHMKAMKEMKWLRHFTWKRWKKWNDFRLTPGLKNKRLRFKCEERERRIEEKGCLVSLKGGVWRGWG